MSPRIGRIAIGAMMATTVALGIPMAQAATTTFDFSVVFDINTVGQFSSAFPEAATSQFTTPGLYEETNTTTKTVANVGTLGSTIVAQNHPSLLTTFVQNASPSNQLVFTSFGTSPINIFPGFALSNLPGVVRPNPTWQYVRTTSTTTASFTEEIGGATTQFSLDSIGLANLQSCSCSTSVTIEGFLGGLLKATDIVSIPGNFVGGNGNTGVPASVDIFTLPATFGDVDKVEILPLGANVNVNDITVDTVGASVPEPSTWAMMLIGFAGLGYAAYRRTKRDSVAKLA
jgi:hypothetical protein